MTERRRAAIQLMSALAAAVALVGGIDLLTNSIATSRFAWDLRYYIDMARRGLVPPLASPFAYRYVTPLLAGLLSKFIQTDVEAGFGWIARVSAVTQLFAVFLLAKWHSRSARAGWMAMLATAFSFYHVKFLLFDTFRPDHLAYPLIILQTYLAMRGKFWPLWIVTLIGCQIREFNAIPLMAWAICALWSARDISDRGRRATLVWQVGASILGLATALLLPRILIPVAEDFQFASLTRDGVLRAMLAPLIVSRDANFIYSVLAYLLPLLILSSPWALRFSWASMRGADRLFLNAYCAIVLMFTFLGGTDFGRFATFLLPAMVLLLARVTGTGTRLQLVGTLVLLFMFNRIWMPIPVADVDRYLDFYGANGTRFSLASWLRVGELALLCAAGVLMRRMGISKGNAKSTLAK